MGEGERTVAEPINESPETAEVKEPATEPPSPIPEPPKESLPSIPPPPPPAEIKIASIGVRPSARGPASTLGLPGGGGGDIPMKGISDIVEDYPNSLATINIDVTGSMESARDAVANLLPEILGSVKNGSVAINCFRDRKEGEPNEFIIPPTPATRNPTETARLIERVKRVKIDGGGDAPETGYQIVIHNMSKRPAGTRERPHIEFIVTDAPEKEPELMPEMLALAARTNTLIFNIDVSIKPPLRTQLR